MKTIFLKEQNTFRLLLWFTISYTPSKEILFTGELTASGILLSKRKKMMTAVISARARLRKSAPVSERMIRFMLPEKSYPMFIFQYMIDYFFHYPQFAPHSEYVTGPENEIYI
jgi:hypothetical protein